MRVRHLAFLFLLVSAASLPAQQADALLLFRQGREFESAGKMAEANAKYLESVKVCDQELAATPGRLESHVVKAWSLLRLKRYSEVISVGQAGLKISQDMRLVEVMGEAYYFLNDMDSCLKFLQRYTDNVPDTADRVSTAYFYMAEAYARLKKYDHADIAYALAVYKEPTMTRWWYRMGNARENKGDLKGALAAYEKALALLPTMTDAITARDRVKGQIQ